MCSLIVSRCVTTVENVRIVSRNRCWFGLNRVVTSKYTVLYLFEPASGVMRILQHSLTYCDHQFEGLLHFLLLRTCKSSVLGLM